MKKLLKLTMATALAIASIGLFCIKVEAQTNFSYMQITAIIQTNSWAMINELDGSLTGTDGHYIIPPQYIALRAKVHSETVTNWTTTGTIWPTTSSSQTNPDGTPSMINNLIYHATGYIQSGTITSNTIAEIEWQGNWIPVVIKTQSLGSESRTVWK